MLRSTLCLLSFSVVVDAVRKHRKSSSQVTLGSNATGAPGYVDTLITYGAPKVSSPELRNPASPDGCFKGWRFVNKNNRLLDPFDNVDLVATLLGQVSGYAHVRMPVQFMDQRGRATYHECGWTGRQVNTPDLYLHFIWVYSSRGKESESMEMYTTIGFDNSYDANVDRVAEKVAERGWTLVSAVMGWEVVHLIQNPRDKACMLTFGGSDTVEDFVKDVVIITTSFCGLEQRVHTGFKWEYLDMVKDRGFQENVRPNLGACAKLDVVGHSLGGAVASLFAACLANAPRPGSDGYEDFQWIEFTREVPRALPSVGPSEETLKKLIESSDGIA